MCSFLAILLWTDLVRLVWWFDLMHLSRASKFFVSFPKTSIGTIIFVEKKHSFHDCFSLGYKRLCTDNKGSNGYKHYNWFIINKRGGRSSMSTRWIEENCQYFSTINTSCKPYVQIKSTSNKSAPSIKRFRIYFGEI